MFHWKEVENVHDERREFVWETKFKYEGLFSVWVTTCTVSGRRNTTSHWYAIQHHCNLAFPLQVEGVRKSWDGLLMNTNTNTCLFHALTRRHPHIYMLTHVHRYLAESLRVTESPNVLLQSSKRMQRISASPSWHKRRRKKQKKRPVEISECVKKPPFITPSNERNSAYLQINLAWRAHSCSSLELSAKSRKNKHLFR